MEIDLYSKYKTGCYKEIGELNPLSFILRKAELGKNLTEAEWDWLDQQQLIDTKEPLAKPKTLNAVISNNSPFHFF